ncbi:MAG: F0F1 ATP synthase subunit B [Candidatus Omnitrophica bacterium]|nr:F0F1 ATP synthase subunit B [Candidatus Omnitrophota bacterium]
MDNKQIFSEIIVQILGFLIVFAILKQFAWKGLLGAIDARRRKIEEGFSEIDGKKRDLEELHREYRSKIANIEQEARAKIQEAAGEGLRVAGEIQEKARQDAEKIVERARVEIQQDLQKARLEMRDETVEVSSLMTEKILRQKLDAKEHERLVEQFIKEMEGVS